MEINKKVWDTINKYRAYGDIYMEEYGNEYSLEEELIGIFDNRHMTQYIVDVFDTFDSPGKTVYAVAVAYVDEDNRLEMITGIVE